MRFPEMGAFHSPSTPTPSHPPIVAANNPLTTLQLLERDKSAHAHAAAQRLASRVLLHPADMHRAWIAANDRCDILADSAGARPLLRCRDHRTHVVLLRGIIRRGAIYAGALGTADKHRRQFLGAVYFRRLVFPAEMAGDEV